MKTTDIAGKEGSAVSTLLQICQLRIRTMNGWQAPYDLDAPVVGIVGPVDTGKSSMLDCISFPLGRQIDEWRGAVDIHLHAVEVVIRVAAGTFTLRRSRRRSSYVEVFDAAGTHEGRFPIKMQENKQTISDWLLQQVGLADAFAAATQPGNRRLTFADALLPYLYRQQDDIDRHVVLPRRDDAVRLASLKLMLNLTTPEYERLAGTARTAAGEIDRRRQHMRIVGDFLGASESMRADALRQELLRLEIEEQDAAKRLADLRAQARGATPDDVDQLLDLQRRAREAVAEAEEDLIAARKEHRAAERELAAIEEGLAELSRAERQLAEEPGVFRIVDITRCLQCGQDVTERTVPAGHCHACVLPLPGARYAGERRHLSYRHQMATARLEHTGLMVRATEGRAAAARKDAMACRETLDDATRVFVAPFADALAAASARLAGINAQRSALARLQEAHVRLQAEHDGIAELEAAQAQRLRDQSLQQGALEPFEDVLGQLDATFRRIIKGIDLPHATGQARLDPTSLLPLVDEQAFGQRGGGARAAVNVAYSLALLTYTLERQLATLPALLMIDSPKKNFGANPDDAALAHRVYRRFLDQMSDRDEIGLARPFQLIIVDNDIPDNIRDRIKVCEFQRDDGFIRDLDDPHAISPQMRQTEIDDFTSDE